VTCSGRYCRGPVLPQAGWPRVVHGVDAVGMPALRRDRADGQGGGGTACLTLN
jgi:hypothetical protein